MIAVCIIPTLGSQEVEASKTGANHPPDLIVTGHQWWWEIRYPASGVVTANELHLPTGKRLLVRGQAMAAGLQIGLREEKVEVIIGTALVDVISINGTVTCIDVRNNSRKQQPRLHTRDNIGSSAFDNNSEIST